MIDLPLPPLTEARVTWRDDLPFADAFGDSYFSRAGGPAETRHVFIHGNHLPERFRQLPANGLFVIGETGFGTGLNFLEAATCFLATAPTHARLTFISTELHPLPISVLAQAHAHWPEHAALAASLQRLLPPACPGFHLLHPHPRIDLLLLLGDANQLLPELDARVDAWFLDGFAPDRNAALWQPALCKELARLSRPGASFATYTVAASVRQALAEAGFLWQKQPGYGSKRTMLAGHWQGDWQPHHYLEPRVAIIGAGIAGVTLAQRLASVGADVTLLDHAGLAQGASGNLAGAIYTTPSAHFDTQNRFYQTAYLNALSWLAEHHFPRQPEEGRLNGIVQLPAQARLVKKQKEAQASGYWPASLLRAAPDYPDGTVIFPRGGYLNPAAWCAHLLASAPVTFRQQQVHQLVHTGNGWQLQDSHNTLLTEADVVILANACDAQAFLTRRLPLKRVRGQITHVQATAASQQWQQLLCHQGFVTPALHGLHVVGASFDHKDGRLLLKPEDDLANLALLREWLPEVWQTLGGAQLQVVSSRVGVRCMTPDYLPLVGQADPIDQPQLWLDIAHGSRALTTSTLSADLLASQITGLPCPVDRTLVRALAPARYLPLC